jgi:4-amino-4-deoxy-L-arabinose transferase-like glycosyltransferase
MKAQAIPVANIAQDIPQPRRQFRGSLLGAAAIFFLSLACFLPLPGGAPLAGTEGHRVFPALNMVRTGDWLLPRLYGQLYLIKPPLHDWLIAIAQIIWGHRGGEFVWRLPSAVVGALLNVALYLFGTRWFGRIGGIVSGLCGLGLLCLWGQARTADVDATNTLACSLAALCLIELYFGRPSPRWPWIIGAGLALGATLMTKGPAGLPLIVGVILWAFWTQAQRESRAKPLLRSASFWVPLLIGAGLFATYAVAAKLALNRLRLPPDYSGAVEVANKFYPATFTQFLVALCIPFEIFAFTLPVSIALPLAFVREFRSAIVESEQEGGMPRSRLTRAMAASVLISWGICVATGMVNPRYAYVTVAPLCLMAGALAASVPYQIPEARAVFRSIVLGSVVLLFGGSVALTALSWRGGIGHFAMVASLCVGLIVAVVTFIRIASRPDFRAAWGMLALLVLAAIPFAYQFRLDRFDRSGYGQANALRTYVGGPGAPVLSGAVLHSLPELFWYAGLHPQTTPTFALQNPRQYPGGTWVVMDPEEHRRWSIFAPSRLSRIKKFISHKDEVYLAWFSREESGSTTAPVTQP